MIDRSKLFPRNKDRRASVLALVFLLPYIEIAIVRETLTLRLEKSLIPASVSFMLIIMLVLSAVWLLNGKGRNSTLILRTVVRTKILLDLFLLFRGLFVLDLPSFFIQYIWFVVPFYYAASVASFILLSNVSKVKFLIAGMTYFSIYLIVNIILNITSYGFEFVGISLQSRVISPGGGAVVLGYSIVVMSCILLYLKENIRFPISLFFVVVFLLGAFFSGSRGSIWPTLFLTILFLLKGRKVKAKMVLILSIITFIILISPQNTVAELVPRTMSFSDEVRQITLLNSLELFSKQSFGLIIVGNGFSGVFPYHSWLTNRTWVKDLYGYNLFFYNNKLLLVQPHNTFLYLLLEGGIIGLALFVYIFIRLLKVINNYQTRDRFYAFLVIAVVLLLNSLDAVFIVQPGSAGLWWLLLFSIGIGKT